MSGIEYNVFSSSDNDVFSSIKEMDLSTLLSQSVPVSDTVGISLSSLSTTPSPRRSQRSPRKFDWSETSINNSLDYSKILHSLRSCNTVIIPHLHKTMIELCLRNKIRCLEDGFWFDIVYGSKSTLIFEPERLDAYDDVHKYWLSQSPLWRNEFPWKNYDIVDDAKNIIQQEFPYMTDEVLNRLLLSKHKFTRYTSVN